MIPAFTGQMDRGQILAMKMRFAGSYSDGKQVLHRLPNNVIVVTLDMNLAENLNEISRPPGIGETIAAGVPYCKADGVDLSLPFDAVVVDSNQDVQKMKDQFKVGLTTTFIVMLKLPQKAQFSLPNEFHSLY